MRLNYLLVASVCSFLILTGTAQEITEIKGLQSLKKGLSFLVVGDWGRNGEYRQKETAQQMGQAAKQNDASFIISVGDNFYPKGVKSIYDPHWNKSFEDIYTAHSLQEDWYVVLGNHDYKENPNAQIEYSSISRRWKMPSRHYVMEKPINESSKVVFIYLDTNPFETKYYSDEDELFRKNVLLNAKDTLQQVKWLDSVLNAHQTATWKIVVGHHPIYSAGKRKGLTDDVAKRLEPIFNKHKVDVYFCGHEHHLEHDIMNNHLHQFISGAGSEVRPVTSNIKTKFVASDHGFASVSVNERQLIVQFINSLGKVLYTTTISK